MALYMNRNLALASPPPQLAGWGELHTFRVSGCRVKSVRKRWWFCLVDVRCENLVDMWMRDDWRDDVQFEMRFWPEKCFIILMLSSFDLADSVESSVWHRFQFARSHRNRPICPQIFINIYINDWNQLDNWPTTRVCTYKRTIFAPVIHTDPGSRTPLHQCFVYRKMCNFVFCGFSRKANTFFSLLSVFVCARNYLSIFYLKLYGNIHSAMMTVV